MSLNTFEERLLDELRTRVEERSAASEIGSPARPPRRRRRLAAAAVVAAAVGIGVAGIFVPEPAWSVSETNSGAVEIRINRPEGAAELTRRLAEVGIRADIQFPPDGYRCASGRFVDAPESESKAVSAAEIGSAKIALTVEPDRFTPGTVLVVEVASHTKGFGNNTDFTRFTLATATGSPDACRLIPITRQDVDPTPPPG